MGADNSYELDMFGNPPRNPCECCGPRFITSTSTVGHKWTRKEYELNKFFVEERNTGEIIKFIRKEIANAKEEGRREGAMYGPLSEETTKLMAEHEAQRKQEARAEVLQKIEDWANYEITIHKQLEGEWTGIRLDGTMEGDNYHSVKLEVYKDLLTFINSLKTNSK